MKWLKFGLVAILSLLFLSFAVVVAANLGDENLNPEVKTLLEEKISPEPAKVQGYKYLLGLDTASDLDPLKVGETIYQKYAQAKTDREPSPPPVQKLKVEFTSAACQNERYCPKATVASARKELEDELKQNQLLVDRFEILLKDYPGFASDLPKRVTDSLPANLLLRLHRLRLLRLSLLAQDHGEAQMARELARSTSFFTQSLADSDTAIETSVLLMILSDNRKFLLAAAAELPKVRAALTPDLSAQFQLQEGFERVAQNVIAGETRIVANAVLHEFHDLCSIGNLTESDCQNGFWVPLSRWFVPALIKRNQTANRFYAAIVKASLARCVRTNETCVPDSRPNENLSLISNPLGNRALAIFRLEPSAFKEMFSKAREIVTPLTLEPSTSPQSNPKARAKE